MKKVTALLTAVAMISSMALAASAEGTSFIQGDVDMDGVVTGHDTAMVSRYLLDDSYVLTEEQLKLADVDGDGTVTQADADMLSGMEVYALGGVGAYFSGAEESGKYPTLANAQRIIEYYSYSAANDKYDFTEVQKNLSDVDLNGVIDINDAIFVLKLYCRHVIRLDNMFAKEGVYYCSSDKNSPAYFIDQISEESGTF